MNSNRTLGLGVRWMAAGVLVASVVAAAQVPSSAAEEPGPGVPGLNCGQDPEGAHSPYAELSEVRVGSWNIEGWNTEKRTTIPGRSWSLQGEKAAALVAKCLPDALGLQEAWHRPRADYDNRTQYQQLVDEINADLVERGVSDRYAVTDIRNELCGTASATCQPTLGPSSHRIIYNTRTLELIDRSAYRLWPGRQEPTYDNRWVAMAAFQPLQANASGKRPRFIFATTHLQSVAVGMDQGDGIVCPGTLVAGKCPASAARVKQIGQALDAVETFRERVGPMPVIFGGDFNDRADLEEGRVLDEATSHSLGLRDVLGRTRTGLQSDSTRCTVPAAMRNRFRVPYNKDARLQTRFVTYLGHASKNSCADSGPGDYWERVGAAYDYMLTTGSIRPRSWQTVYAQAHGYDDNLSDHRMLLMSVRYPAAD